MTDLPNLLPSDEARVNAEKFENLMEETLSSSLSMRGRLLRILYSIELYTMTIAGLNMFVGGLLGFVGPLALEGVYHLNLTAYLLLYVVNSIQSNLDRRICAFEDIRSCCTEMGLLRRRTRYRYMVGYCHDCWIAHTKPMPTHSSPLIDEGCAESQGRVNFFSV